MANWFKTRWVEACEVCGHPFGETTGEVDGLLACSDCVFEDRSSRNFKE